MANLFENLALPALNGAGAATDVSSMGPAKTVVVSGDFEGAAITIEVSVDNGTTFAPVATFQSGSTRKELQVAATHMRVNVSGRSALVDFDANIDVGANDGGMTQADLTIPASNGAGASIDVSALGTFNTVIVGGTFPKAAVLIEASEDGTAWAPVCQFSGKGGMWSGNITGNFMRAYVKGRTSGSVFSGVTAAVGAANDPTTAGGGGGGDSAVIFDDSVAGTNVNIRSDRAANQSAIDNTKAGITNLGSQTGTENPAALGAIGAYSTIGGGFDNEASDDSATVPGGEANTASGWASFAAGYGCTAAGDAAVAVGFQCQASANFSTAFGDTSIASALAAFAEGRDTQATQETAHAEGDSTQATGPASHAEGLLTIAGPGSCTHAEGNSTQATANNAHAEGISTVASGQAAHAEGNTCTASGFNSHAEGRNCTASGDYSHAQGVRAVASRSTQFSRASGRFTTDGDAQVSEITMRANGILAATLTPLTYDEGGGLNSMALTDGKLYAFTVVASCGASAAGEFAYIRRSFLARAAAGVAIVEGSGVAEIIGTPTAVANWQLTMTAAGNQVLVNFTTGADAATNGTAVAAKVEFVEVLM